MSFCRLLENLELSLKVKVCIKQWHITADSESGNMKVCVSNYYAWLWIMHINFIASHKNEIKIKQINRNKKYFRIAWYP